MKHIISGSEIRSWLPWNYGGRTESY